MSRDMLKQFAVVLVVILTFVAGCVFDSSQEKYRDFTIVETNLKIDTVYRNISDTVYNYVPKYKTKTFFIHDTVIKVDTIYVLNEFYSKKSYIDTINFDYGDLIIMDTVYQNSIYSREVIKNLIIPQVTISNQVLLKPKIKFFNGYLMGGGVFNLDTNDSSFVQLPVLGAGLGLNIKKVGFVGAEFNLMEKDFRVNYVYNKGRVFGSANYSIGNNRLILNLKYKLF